MQKCIKLLDERNVNFMEKNQKINCTVGSCIYQDKNSKSCTLQAINVVPTPNVKSSQTDESMCGSYKCEG